MGHDPLSATTRLWSLADDVLVEGDSGPGPLTVVTRWGEFVFADAAAPVRAAIQRMSLGPVAVDNVYLSPALDRILDRLSGSVVHSIQLDDRQELVVSAAPTGPTASFALCPPEAGQPVRLSRFTMLRPDDGRLSLESAFASFQVGLQHPVALRIVEALTGATTAEKLADSAELPVALVRDVVSFLAAANVVVYGDQAGVFSEDRDPALRPWTHHALLFHRLSRSRHQPSEQAVPIDSPAVKPIPAGERIPLDTPQPTEPEISLTEVLETDLSCPDFTTRELSFAQVSALLYRSARVRGGAPPHLPHGMSYPASRRPYRSIGCLYELELYLTVQRCAGLLPAMYHYDPAGHALTLVNTEDDVHSTLLDTAKVGAGCTRRPSLLITIAARMDRTTVLGGAAYATSLTHVGALQQTLSLVATSLGLAAHAIPIDTDEAVDRAIGLDWPAEVVVGQSVIDRPA